ncbi:MAG: DUF4910 domain-containing protein [Candidatus Omnitrophota bacterium]|nr:MAG: DUF4910 domain-containing protein [Candidatus Omnitrophota bacterium]
MKNIISDLWFEKRNIVSEGFDDSLRYISKLLPMSIIEIPTGTECWSWTVPPKWSLKEGWIRRGNKVYLDYADHPLHIMAYSEPVKKKVRKEELLSHIDTYSHRPSAIPFGYSYYEKKWGFCIQNNKLADFREDSYEICIDSKFSPGRLKIGELVLPGKLKDEIVLIAHLCHPCMANDNLSGVAVLIATFLELAKSDSHKYTYRLLLVPETIGSIAYLSRNEHLIKNMKYGIVIDCVGHNDILSLQHSKQADTELDYCASYVLKNEALMFREGAINKVCVSDEVVFNGPGVNIPTISLSRFKFWDEGAWPYPEYHSSDDTPDIIVQENLSKTKEVILKILEIMDSNFVPKRTFKGPLFLSKYGLWVDWRKNRKLNSALNDVMFSLEGNKSALEIAKELDISYTELYAWLNKLERLNLIKK